MTGPILQVWRDILERPIGPDTDIFTHGASSLSVARFIVSMSTQHQVTFTIDDVLRHRTVRELEAVFRQQMARLPGSRSEPRRPGLGDIPARGSRTAARSSFKQRQRLLHDERACQLAGKRPVQHVSSAYHVVGSLSRTRVGSVLETLSKRYDVLRSVFPSPDTVRIVDAIDMELTEIRLDTVGNVSDSRLAAVMDELRDRPFAVDEGPCWRVGLIRLEAQASVLIFVFDHLLVDAWALGVFEREFRAVHDAIASGEPIPAHRREPSYYDWSDWQWELRENGHYQRLLDQWRAVLDPTAPLPVLGPANPDGHRGSDTSAIGEEQCLIPAERIGPGLEYAVREAGATPYSCLLAAYVKSLAENIANLDGTVNSVLVPVANREHPQSLDIIGWMANMSVIRFGAVADMPYLELARRTQQELTAAAPRSMLPFSILAEEFVPGAQLEGYTRQRAAFDLFDARSDPGLRLRGLRVSPLGESAMIHPVPGFSLQAMFTPTGDLLLRARHELDSGTRVGVENVLPAMERIVNLV